MQRIKEKRERALGVKLFLKAERCNSPKCAMVRKPHRPGIHGAKPKSLSEYGRQLQEKQKIQLVYGLNNKQMTSIFKKYKREEILSRLERRLDRVVFLLGLAKSPRIARQLISHGHIIVNGKKVTIPSFLVKKGETIEIKPVSRKMDIFSDLVNHLKNHKTPEWLKIDKEQFKGVCLANPETDFYAIPFNTDLVREFYSK